MNVEIVRLPHAGDIPLPEYASSGSAGLDVRAAVNGDTEIQAGETLAIPSGFRIAIPEGFEAQIRPRSGLALNNSIGILNSPGTIDSDYRGEVRIILTNLGKTPFIVHRGDRIAQLVLCRYERVQWQLTSELADSERGEGGFGHTGR